MKQYMPREKLRQFGPENLSDVELLRILIGSGNQQSSAEKIAKRLLKLLQERGDKATYQEVSAIPGMGPAKTCEIIALFELGRRYLIPADRPVVQNADDAFALLDNIKNRKQECLAVLTLNGANRLISNDVVFQGTLDQSLVHPREIFSKALEDRAASIIVAHNHPSGNIEASQQDVTITCKLKEIGELMGIPVLDHLIVTSNAFQSINDLNDDL